MSKPTRFTDMLGHEHQIEHTDSLAVVEGVLCDTYAFTEDASRDLAIVTVNPGVATPLHEVVSGTKTLEGYVSGAGKLCIAGIQGATTIHTFGQPNIQKTETTTKEIEIVVGDIVQWRADPLLPLTFYEICEPPYEDGRFRVLTESAPNPFPPPHQG